jgi:hypothetical protein
MSEQASTKRVVQTPGHGAWFMMFELPGAVSCRGSPRLSVDSNFSLPAGMRFGLTEESLASQISPRIINSQIAQIHHATAYYPSKVSLSSLSRGPLIVILTHVIRTDLKFHDPDLLETFHE